jgi:hypothetical protein
VDTKKKKETIDLAVGRRADTRRVSTQLASLVDNRGGFALRIASISSLVRGESLGTSHSTKSATTGCRSFGFFPISATTTGSFVVQGRPEEGTVQKHHQNNDQVPSEIDRDERA